ncbi:hypothetical protein BU52_16035 [Streptomyces toyocaensis]|uniref:Uncharacterized protein n=1 Tax=Streptomyces toyocaensis TaxID=55952 RepID=A0A081XRR9_STRTO|nr:pyridoxamine 5'-phosphate oxidase family protein [Streptomyces toyocaensis]KES06242.1 hypothetical protein BU52_16035 [Streptomyces toyocaensis]
MSTLTCGRLDLLERPLLVHPATPRPDGTPQSHPMRARWDRELLWSTSTTGRRKYRNITAEPPVAVSVNDPDQPSRCLEAREIVERIDPDPERTLLTALTELHGRELNGAWPGDAPDRAVPGVRPVRTSRR